MDINPYMDSAENSAATPETKCSIWSRLGWFALGFVVSWGVWSSISYIRTRPRDVTAELPDEMRELVSSSEEAKWMRDAVARKVGRFVIFAPADPNNASAMIQPLRPLHRTAIMFFDDDVDGLVDSISVTDAGHRAFTLAVAESQFQDYMYSTGFRDDSFSFWDANMDGRFDYRINNGAGQTEVHIDHAWHPKIEDEGEVYVVLNGKRVLLKQVDRVWQIAEGEEEKAGDD